MMKLERFNSYEDYVTVQTETNKQKLTHVWVTERELRKVARYIRKRVPSATFGVCHGVRNGFEVAVLRNLLGIEVVGTEISDTATRFPNVIQWDFHEVKHDWVSNCDFVYSNSWDHSYNPDLMLERRMACLRPTGRCFLEWTRNHMPKSVYGADCFGIDYLEFLDWIRKAYEVEAVIRLNRSGPSEIFRRPMYWLKGQVVPVRVVVVRNRGRGSVERDEYK
jgi:hypothetical protein